MPGSLAFDLATAFMRVMTAAAAVAALGDLQKSVAKVGGRKGKRRWL